MNGNEVGYGKLFDRTQVNFLFFSMQKCGACEDTKPEWVEFMESDTYTELKKIYVDCTDNMDLCQYFGIHQLPRWIILAADNNSEEDLMYQYP